MWYLTLLAVAVLIGMASQDFKFRAISLGLFLMLFLILGTIKALTVDLREMCFDFLLNVGFLAVQVLCLSIYFAIKRGRLVNIFSEDLGLGDLLFLFSIASYFSFFNYVFFYLSSLAACLLTCLVISLFNSGFLSRIPLAGMQAVILIGFLTVTFFGNQLSLTNDRILLEFLGF